MRSLPQREVAGVALAAWIRILRGLHLVDPLTGELAVRRPRPDVEVDVTGAVGCRVGVTGVDQCLDQLQHLRDVSGGPRLVRRGSAAEDVVRLVQRPLEPVGVRPPRATRLRRLGQDLVLDVGDVGDDRDVVADPFQPPTQHVEDNLLVDVTDMWSPLHGESAVIDADLTGHERLERAHLSGQAVVETETHRQSVSVGVRRDAEISVATATTADDRTSVDRCEHGSCLS
jgi:hypothetical protein